jgi:flagellar hook assembly protein FlgD
MLPMLLILVVLASVQGQAQEAIVEVGITTATEGSTGTVTVSLSGASGGLSDFQGKLIYDSSIVNVREVTGMNEYTVAAFQIDNFAGETRFIGFKSSGNLLTEGEFLRFTLAAVGPTNADTPLNIEFVSFNGNSGAILHITRPGRFNIGARQDISVDFDWSPPVAEISQPVQFSDLSSGGSGTFVSWTWDFGDGEASSDQNPAHTYTAEGTYSVSLTVEDDQGGTNSITKDVLVLSAGEASKIRIHNFPNPASSSTTFSYFVPRDASQALLTVYAFTGPLVFTRPLDINSTQFVWNLQDQAGNELPNGPYIYRIWVSTPAGAKLSEIGKMVIIR